MYEPDRVFMAKLKRLDPRLGCYYAHSHEHFVITYDRAIGGAVPIMVVEDENKRFRQPDTRDIETLKEFDTHRVSMHERLQHTALYMERVREEKRHKARENIRDMTKDDKHQLANKFAKLTGGKHNSTFRRINVKPKGKVFN